MKTTQKASKGGSTQKFTEISEIYEDVVVFTNGNACLVIEVQASNFALLSAQEQQAKIYAYASLLNSLSFSIQIVIQNKKIDISSYLKLLDAEYQKAAAGSSLVQPGTQGGVSADQVASYIKLYRNFVEELIRVNTVLDKKFYIIVPYSPLEKGIQGATNAMKKNASAHDAAKTTLQTKADGLNSQLARVGLRARTLERDDLIKLFFEIYNQTQEAAQIDTNTQTPVVKTM